MRNTFRSLLALLLVAVFSSLASSRAAAMNPEDDGGPEAQPTPVPSTSMLPHASIPSALANPGRKVDVLVELAEPPLVDFVARQQAAGAAAVDGNAQIAYTQRLRAAQAPVVAAASQYGTVVYQLTNLFNAIGVSGVDPAHLDDLRAIPGVVAVHVSGIARLDDGQKARPQPPVAKPGLERPGLQPQGSTR